MLLYEKISIYTNRNGDTPFVRLQAQQRYTKERERETLSLHVVCWYENEPIPQLCLSATCILCVCVYSYICTIRIHTSPAHVQIVDVCMRVCVAVAGGASSVVCANDLLCHNILSPSRCVCWCAHTHTRVCVCVCVCVYLLLCLSTIRSNILLCIVYIMRACTFCCVRIFSVGWFICQSASSAQLDSVPYISLLFICLYI